MVRHSYIIELKYLKTEASQAESAEQWRLAVEQIRQYGEADRVKAFAVGTQLHLLVMQIRGWQMERMDEISLNYS